MGSTLNNQRRVVPTPLQLAYIGDAVWELHVRRTLLEAGAATMDDIHRGAVARVQAAEQAAVWHRIADRLTDEEQDIARRARNAKLNTPKGASAADYRYSTCFECVLGYLYWTGQRERLREVIQIADESQST